MWSMQINSHLTIKPGFRPDHQTAGTDIIGMRSHEITFDLFAHNLDARFAVKAQQSRVKAVQLCRVHIVQQTLVRDGHYNPVVLFLEQNPGRAEARRPGLCESQCAFYPAIESDDFCGSGNRCRWRLYGGER